MNTDLFVSPLNLLISLPSSWRPSQSRQANECDDDMINRWNGNETDCPCVNLSVWSGGDSCFMWTCVQVKE